MTHATCRLVLEDGTIVHGRSFGATSDEPIFAEVVFNTAMCGYQEALTDPSYSGQILIMTAPQIGNYGVNATDNESNAPKVAGFVVKELSRIVSNYRADSDLASWLAEAGILAMEGVDTRAIVRRIRTAGVLRGVMTTDLTLSDEALLAQVAKSLEMAGQDLATPASCQEKTSWEGDLGEWNTHADKTSKKWKVVSLDCGAKHNIYRHLTAVGCEVISLPNTTTAADILALEPDGLFVSNGPGDPSAVTSTLETLQALIGKMPIFGICLGHQLLALSLGAKTWKLKFGHRGANQPVSDLETGKIEITSQNHGFCVDEASLVAVNCTITHRHLNDDTVAGFKHNSLPIMGVQYHPEASPGPHDSAYLFQRFVEMMESHLLAQK